MTTVLMVSGSWPPQACGVGDYSEVLSRELERKGISVLRYSSEEFARLYSAKIVAEIERLNCDLVHIQYPTAGYGRSLTPSAVARAVHGKPVVVTLHEYSSFGWYRRPWFSPYARDCAARIFTTDNERESFERRFPKRNGVDSTIEIASNIPTFGRVGRRPDRVCFFGLIWPGRGIEDFIDLCVASGQAAGNLSFELIGAIPERHQRYAADILKRASASGIQISLNLSDEGVAERLANASFAYLPFPDGASAKRGTLAAAIVNGLLVVTRHSEITPDWIRSATLGAKTAEGALGEIWRLRSNSHLRAEMKARVERAAARFRWDTIAHRHLDLYQSLLGMDGGDARNGAEGPLASDAPAQSRLAS